uniref:Uncharacterized protein n=1 Tax=Rhodnius prolixus TaxID=13249 RepID=T1HTV7_RHOPR
MKRRSMRSHGGDITATLRLILPCFSVPLDKLMHEKQAQQQEEMRRNINQELHDAATEPPWGKTGPGGQQWRTPRQVGLNFLHSLGWTSEKAFRRLEDQIDRKKPEQLMIQSAPAKVNDFKTPEEELTGGIELVPLLARRRSFKKSQTHLPTCDVTNKALNEDPPAWKEIRQPQDYLRDLNNQVNHKQLQMKAEKEVDRRDCRKHFETWGRFWGRPGHGAPRQSKNLLDVTDPYAGHFRQQNICSSSTVD